jgi:hypothetical protein
MDHSGHHGDHNSPADQHNDPHQYHMNKCNIGMQMKIYWGTNCTFVFKG